MPETREVAAANRMYWDSDESVAEIAARFDCSRRALYELVRPLPTGVACDECGKELVFENRLARKRGSATCQACGAVQEGVDALDLAGVDRRGGPAGAHEFAAGTDRDGRDSDLRHRAVLLGGVAIAGVAIGGVATWLARRRDT